MENNNKWEALNNNAKDKKTELDFYFKEITEEQARHRMAFKLETYGIDNDGYESLLDSIDDILRYNMYAIHAY